MPVREGIDVVLVADVHERVPKVRKAKPPGGSLGQMEGITVSVGEGEVGTEHKLTIRPLAHSYILTKART